MHRDMREHYENRLKTRWMGRTAGFYEVVDSTNILAKEEAKRGAASGTLIVADRQTAGRGRRGREWKSPGGTNLYFTLMLKPDFAPDKASMLTLVMAHAVAEAVSRSVPVRPGIKWPNDIVMDGKKVCGILTEMELKESRIASVVIGVGINVHRQAFPTELKDRAASLEQFGTLEISRGALLADIMEVFEADYEAFCREESLAALRTSYESFLVNKDREVCVLDPRGEFRGIARGITDAGELLVELADKSTVSVYAGEVSVRGIYGYV